MAIAGRVVLILMLIAFALFVFSVAWLFWFNGLETIANWQLGRMLGRDMKLDVNVGSIEGNLISEVELHDVTVRYVSEDTAYTLAEVPRIQANYSLSNLFDSNFDFAYLNIERGRFTIMTDSAGKWLLPGKKSASPSAKQALPHIAAQQLVIHDASIKVLRPEDTLVVEGFSLDVVAEVVDQSMAVDINHLGFSSNDDRIQLSRATGKLTFSNNYLLFREVALVLDTTIIKLEGGVSLSDTLSGEVDFAIDNIDMSHATAFAGPALKGVLDLNGGVRFVRDSLSGSVHIRGDFMIARFDNLYTEFVFSDKIIYLDTLVGTILGDCSIDGKGSIDVSSKPEHYWLKAQLRNFNLKELVPKAFESDLSGYVDIVGVGFWGKPLAINLDVDLSESSFDGYPIQVGRGKALVTSDSISFADSFHVAFYENLFYASGKVDYDSTMILNLDLDLNNLDRFRQRIFIEEPGGRGKLRATFSGRTSDPDLKAEFVSDSVWIYGFYSDSAAINADIKRFFSGKQGSVDAGFGTGLAWGLKFDSSMALLTIDSNLVYIDTVAVCNQIAKIEGRGLFDYGPDPMPLTLDTMAVRIFEREFVSSQPLALNFDSLGIGFERASLGSRDSRITVQGRADYNEDLALDVTVDNVLIGPWLELLEWEWDIDGKLSSIARIGGNMSQPVVDIKTAIDSLSYESLVLGDFVTAASYNDRRLDIDSVKIVSDSGEYRADGFLHMDLAMTGDSLDRFPDLPLDIRFSAIDRKFDLVTLLMPDFEAVDGLFSADFRLHGSPKAPELEGENFLIGDPDDPTCIFAKVRFVELEDRVFVDSAGITMHNNVIEFDDVHVYTPDSRRGLKDPCDKKGNRAKSREELANFPYAVINGQIKVHSMDELDYDLEVNLGRGWPFTYTMDEISGRAWGDLQVTGMNPPTVSGDIALLSGRYMVNFTEEGQGSPILAALEGENMWNLDINVDILRNYWIKNDDIDAEFSGEINIKRTNGEYRFFGEMEFLRGRAFLADKVFTINPGSRVIFNGEDSLNGTLDISACTHITGYSTLTDSDTETPERFKVCVLITGTVDAPEINPDPDSDLPLTKEELLPLLLANYYTGGDVAVSGDQSDRVGRALGAYVSKIGSQQVSRWGIGVETIEIDPYSSGQFDPGASQITVGFYALGGGYYRVGGAFGQGLNSGGVEYRLSRNFFIDGRTDEELLYRLGLKLHWEF